MRGADDADIEVVEGPVVGLPTDHGRLQAVVVANGQQFEHPVLFVPPDLLLRTRLLSELGAATDSAGWPTLDRTGATSVPGVSTIGNTADSTHKVVHAAASGATAAQAINEDLLRADLARLATAL